MGAFGELDERDAVALRDTGRGAPPTTNDNERGRNCTDDERTHTPDRHTQRGAESDRREETEDRTGAAHGARGRANTDERCAVLLARHAAVPNIDATIGTASAGALTSSATPRMSTVIANWKNWQQSCSAATRRISSAVPTLF